MVGLASCGGEELSPLQPIRIGNREAGQLVVLVTGDPLELTLQTVGPGQYRSYPDVSSTAIVFDGPCSTGDPVPAGARQCFRFHAAAPGRAVISIPHMDSPGFPNAAFEITVDVQG
jgi:hypothetical protein